MPSTRIRSLKPEFFTSPSSAQASPQARLLYMAMWCMANDYGYGETNLLVILGTAFPVSDGVTVEQLEDLLREVAASYGTVFYEVRGRHYYWIPTWLKHQRKRDEKSRQWHPTHDDPDATPDLRFHPETPPVAESCRKLPQVATRSCGAVELGSSGTGEPPYPPRAENSRPERRTDGRGKAMAKFQEANGLARSVDAYRIAEAFSASLPVPIEAGLLAGIGVEIDKGLKSNIPAPVIAQGIKDWTESNSWATSQIQNFIHKAGNRRGTTGKATAKALAYDDAAAQLLKEVATL
jgi:hypothetical protein